MNFRVSAAARHANSFFFSFFYSRWHSDVLCRMLNQWKCFQNLRLWREFEIPLQIPPYPAISETVRTRSAKAHIVLEVLATVPLLWQSTASIQCCAVITFCRASAFPFLRVLWRQYIFNSIPLTFCEFIPLCSHAYSLHNFMPLCKFYFSNKA